MCCCRRRGKNSAAARPLKRAKGKATVSTLPAIDSEDDETYDPSLSTGEESTATTDSDAEPPVDYGPTYKEKKMAKKQKKQRREEAKQREKETVVMTQRDQLKRQSAHQPQEREKAKAKIRRENRVQYAEVPFPMLGSPPDDALTRPTTPGSVQDIVDGCDDCRWFNISAKIFWMVLMAAVDSSNMMLMYDNMFVYTHDTYYAIFLFH